MKEVPTAAIAAQSDDTAISTSGMSTATVRPRLLIVLAALALLVTTAWAISFLAGGLEFRLFDQRLRSGDTGKLKSPVLAQSFTSPGGNLNRLDLLLVGVIPNNLPDDMQVKLLTGEGVDGQIAYQAPVSAARVISDAGDTYLSISFPPQGSSAGRTYTLALETPGYPVNSVIQTAYSPIDALSSGALYTEDGRQAGDLAISAYYRYSLPAFLAETARTITGQLRFILAFVLLLLLPGLALLAWLPNDLNAGQCLLAAPGVTALALPVFYLLEGLVGFSVDAAMMWALLVLCAVAVGLRTFLTVWRYSKKNVVRKRLPNWNRTDVIFWSSLALLLLLATVTRLLSLHGLAAGNGMDAYHHTLITEMFVRDGGIPRNYEPFVPLRSFTYHFGFHGLTAAVAWLTGRTSTTDIMTLMPLVGQFVGSVLPVPGLVLLGWKVLGNRWIGLVAGALGGLVSVVPAYYVEWSRYTQGLGLALLPVAWVLLLSAIEGQDKVRGMASRVRNPLLFVPLAVIGGAGLFLSHYRIVIIYAGFAALYLAWRLVSAFIEGRSLSRTILPIAQIGRAAITGAFTLAVLAPWIINLNRNFVKNFIDRSGLDIDIYFATGERLGAPLLNHFSVPLLAALSAIAVAIFGWKETRNRRAGLAIGGGAGVLAFFAALYVYFHPSPTAMQKELQSHLLGLSPVTWVLVLEIAACVALVWLAQERKALLLLPALVWLILGLWSSPQLLPFRLPFVGYLDAVTLASVSWLPVMLLAGYAVVTMGRWAWNNAELLSLVEGRRGVAIALSSVAAGALVVSGLALGMSLSPVHDRGPYVVQSDAEALLWMRDNLPRDSYVLGNSFTFPWAPTQLLGMDSGLWVPLLAEVRSTLQPIAAYNEQPADPQYFDKVRAIVPPGPLIDKPEEWKALKSAGVTHIYIGSNAGERGYSAQALLQNKHVTLVYHKDAVWLFKIL